MAAQHGVRIRRFGAALEHRALKLRAWSCLLAFAGSVVFSFTAIANAAASASTPDFTDVQSLHALALLNAQSCAQRVGELLAQTTPPASPSPSPSSSPTVPPGVPGGPMYATPYPASSPVTPLPVPTPTPVSSGSPGPVFLERGSAPPSIAPKGTQTASASPSPSPAPTLPPGYVAVLADKVTGSTKPGIPGDAIGNVHVLYQDEEIVGDRAHYDGIRTITISGKPYIINKTKDSILYSDKITFDTIAQKAALVNGRGESTQGVEQGLAYFGAQSMQSDQHGVSHGTNATFSTCARPRAGYHVTGKTIDVYPGDKIVINRAVLWLGAAAVFLLPHLVIPLRTVSDQRQKPQFFPEMGYNSVQGYYILTRLSFGYTNYYYGYYTIDFYTKQGTTLGYNGTINKKNGKRSTTINVQRVQNRLPGQQTTSYNAQLQDTEIFSQALRGQFGYSYQSAYGPYTQFPPQSSLTASVSHSHNLETQTYTFDKSSTGTQASNASYGFTDTREFSPTLSNNFAFTLSHSENSGYGSFISSAQGHVTDLVHWASHAIDYQFDYDKNYTNTPSGINKEPEITIRPIRFLPYFRFLNGQIEPTLTVGDYNEPQTPFTAGRADLALSMGPFLYPFLNNRDQFQANFTVNQFYYSTGDEKANVQQNMSLTSEIGQHFNNVVSYNETNYNGPGSVPFSTLDLQTSPNTKNANDTFRVFNGNVYNLSLSFTTQFNAMAQPVSYTLLMRPTAKSYLSLQGSYNPGPGNGFFTTNTQVAFPMGIGGYFELSGNFDWKSKGRLADKSIYYSRIIGECYQLQLGYNQDAKTATMAINILAFPDRAVTFGLVNQGSVVPSGFNGYP